MKIFETFFECSSQNETTSWFLHKFCIPLQFHERLFLCSFLAQTIYALLKRSPVKRKFLRLSSAWVKFCNDKSITLEILYFSSVSWKIIPLYFFSSKNIYFPQKEPSKMKIFETFMCSGQILSNSLCQFWNDESIPLKILYSSSVSWKITPLYFFSSNNIYFAHK